MEKCNIFGIVQNVRQSIVSINAQKSVEIVREKLVDSKIYLDR